MKKLFVTIFLAFLVIPAFSLTFEASYMISQKVNGFTAGVSTNNPIFNTSFGLYYDKHEFTLRHEYREYHKYDYSQGGWWSSTYPREKKTDTIIGPYLQFGWTFLPFSIGKNTKVGFNTALQIAATHSDLATYEIPLSAFLGFQGRFKNFDILTGLKVTFYYHLFIKDRDFKEDKNLDRVEMSKGFPSIPITVRYNFKRKTQAVTPQKQSRTHVIGGANLKPSL